MEPIPFVVFFTTILFFRSTLAFEFVYDCASRGYPDVADVAAMQESLPFYSWEQEVIWNTGNPCCWPMVTCSDTSGDVRVTQIDFGTYSLRGSLPPSFGSLAYLENVTMKSGMLNGSIPESWGNLKKLKWLDLSNNILVGALNVVGNWTELEYLSLGSNQFTGEMGQIPIGSLLSLTSLFLDNNDFTGLFPDWIGNLSKLKDLRLGGNLRMSPSGLPSASSSWPDTLQSLNLYSMNLIGSVPEALVSLPKLSLIDLSHNSLAGSLPTFVLGTSSKVLLNSNKFTGGIAPILDKNIYYIDLSNNFLSGSFMEFFKILCANNSKSTIQYLNASQNNLNGEISSGFGGGNCASLATLDLSHNSLSGTISIFSWLTALNHLYLDDNEFSGELPTLYNINITTFNVANNYLTGKIASIMGLGSIIDLNLSGNHFSGSLPYSNSWSYFETVDLSRNLFNGDVPDTFLNGATNLRELDLSENNLTGDIPSSFFKTPDLHSLNLRGNQFSKFPNFNEWQSISSNLKIINVGNNSIDKFPEWITKCTGLQEMYFDSNKITGAIPSYLGNFSFLQVLDLSNNSFDSGIPDTFGSTEFIYDESLQIFRSSSFSGLSYLDLSRCNLSGTIPESIGYLRLSFLDLSDNQLSGEIPQLLASIPLKHLNLSNNQLSGYVPDLFFSNNLTDCSIYSFLPNPLRAKCKGGFIVNIYSQRLPGYAIALIVVGSTLLIVVAALGAYLWIFKKKEHFITKNINEHTVKFLPLQIISEATDKFSESNELGAGGFGTVYKGIAKNGEVWAVKRAKDASVESLELFKNEVETISRMNHRNLVKLIGFCHTDSEQILVYEFIANGTLKSALERKEGTIQPVLTFEQRVDIALGAAEGLRYLHTQAKPTIIHRDVKSENILLDANMKAKVADFGLLKDNEDQEELSKRTAVAGTYGYMDPEYYTTSLVTTKSDVYSFGVVILELITGQRAIFDEMTSEGDRERTSLANWAPKMMRSTLGLSAIVDPSLESDYSLDDMNALASIAASCLQKRSKYRPEMADVASHLRLLKTKVENRDREVEENNGLTVLPTNDVIEDVSLENPIIRTTTSVKSTSLNSRPMSSFLRTVQQESVLLPR